MFYSIEPQAMLNQIFMDLFPYKRKEIFLAILGPYVWFSIYVDPISLAVSLRIANCRSSRLYELGMASFDFEHFQYYSR